MKNILVTGGTGFIGSNICKYLIKEKYNTIVFDNNSRGNIKRLENIKKKIIFVKGDICKKSDLEKAFKKMSINCVIHLAYINGTKYFYEKPIDVLNVGIKGILNVLELSKKYKIKKFILASSSEVYQKPDKVPTGENESLKVPNIYNPRYSYGAGKILSELLVINYGRKFFKKSIIFRPHNVYSEDMGNEHVIPQFIKKIKNTTNKKIKIRGDGKEIRSFIHIDDFIQAFDLIFRKGKNLEIYNIGTDEKIKIRRLANLISKIMNKKISLLNSGFFIGNTPIRCPDISKIKKLGFSQKIKIMDGLKKIIY